MALVLAFTVTAGRAEEAPRDTLCRMGFSVYGGPTRQLAMDRYERKWLQGKNGMAVGAELEFSSLGKADDGTNRDYNYPSLSLGAQLSLNNGVTMHRTADPAWGQAEMVDYDSHLGNILSLYGAFNRPLFRHGRWQVDYTLRMGIAYATRPYDKEKNVDNELIGSRLNMCFEAGVVASYRFVDEWSVTGGVLFGHHSNGALARPNKGENHVGPVIGIAHHPAPPHSVAPPPTDGAEKTSLWIAHLRFGLGGKTLLEDWQTTQFQTSPEDVNYRTEHFRLYAAWSLSTDVMCRYARRWASGIGCDVFYGTYYHHVSSPETPTSPWSVGIAARHEAYYHQLSCDMALGVYLFRRMGEHAREVEKPYYERIGVSYSFPHLGGFRVGFSVKAHLTKADLTELVATFPFRLSR